MTVRIYRSSDGGAPALNGTAGSLVNVLTWALVTGAGTPAGWSSPYTGTNKAVFRNGTGSNQFYMRVDDTGTTSARIVGYESMTDVDTGTKSFPTETQFSGGLYVVKSTTADLTARAWVIIATEKLFYLHVNPDSNATSSNGNMTCFGDMSSYRTSDGYHTILIANNGSGFTNHSFVNINAGTIVGHFMARAHHQYGSSINVGKFSVTPIAGLTNYFNGSVTYPDPVSGNLLIFPVWINDGPYSTTIWYANRGLLPGTWISAHTRPLSHGDTFSGTGTISTKTFECFNCYSPTSNGQIIIETSNTW